MKRIFSTLFVVLMTCFCAMAQLNIWYNGSIVYQRDYTKIDSITFTIQDVTPPSGDETIDNLPAKIEGLLGTPDDEVRALMQQKGFTLKEEKINNAGELSLLYINDNQDSVYCAFVQSNLLTDVEVVAHFAENGLPFQTYKAWSDAAYKVAAWQSWAGHIRELPNSGVQDFNGHALFASVMKDLTATNYVAEEYNVGGSDDYAVLVYLNGSLVSRLIYVRCFHYLDVQPTAINLPETISVNLDETIKIPYEVQPHGALLNNVMATVDDPSIVEISNNRIIGKKQGTTVLHVTCGEIQTSAVITCQPRLENGMYIVGEATGFADIQTPGVAACQMAIGQNEVNKALRNGMYEKYIYLEANKGFQLVKYNNGSITYYTSSLEKKSLTTDNYEIENGYWGKLSESAVALKVDRSGLYHVVLDLNLDRQLDAAGGAQILIAPVEWGVRGYMNDWGYTKFETETKDNGIITWTWRKQEFADGQAFKFAYGYFWKVHLDVAEQVKAEVSLGKDMVPGGVNFLVDNAGLYDITLTYKLAGGDIKNSFSYTATRTGDIPILDYSDCVLELVGDAIADQDGASQDPSSWGWGNVYSLGKPSKNGNIYTWQVTGVKLLANQYYKVRSLNYQAQGNIKPLVNDRDLSVYKDGEYNITVTIDATTRKMTVSDGLPEPTIITVKARIPSDWTATPTAWVWWTNENGHSETLTKSGQWWVYTTPEAVPELNVIWRNGNSWDTYSKEVNDLHEDACFQISAPSSGETHYNVTEVDCQ